MRLLTPPGVAGVAVVRADADELPDLLACLRAPSQRPFAPGVVPRRAALVIDGQVVDDVLVCARDGALELHTHGAPAVLAQLERRFGLAIDEPPSPAVRLLREALSVEQFDLATEQLEYDFEAELRALLEAAEPARRAGLAALRARSRAAVALAQPERVVLVGRQNAGKSSLFNRLLCRERALTGAVPGLTRDPVAERTVLAGYPYELVDTAGEGEAGDALDLAAIEAGRALRRGGLLLLVVDGCAGVTEVDRRLARDAALVVRSKQDVGLPPWPSDMPTALPVSSLRDDPGDLRDRVGLALRELRGLPPAGRVGGFAALDAAQLRRVSMDGRDEDCLRPSPPA